MDPDATLAIIDNALSDKGEELFDAIQDLEGWLGKGGFAPDWSAYPEAAQAYWNATDTDQWQIEEQGS